MADHQPQVTRREEYRAPDYRIERVELDFDLQPQRTRVRSRLTVRADHDRSGELRPLVLDGEQLELFSIVLDGRALSLSDYRIEGAALIIPEPPESFTLEIDTAITLAMTAGRLRSSASEPLTPSAARATRSTTMLQTTATPDTAM